MSCYGFIGCGNMGSALVTSVAKKIGGQNILLSDANNDKAIILANSCGAKVCNNKELAEKADYIVIGVKPQMCKDLFCEINPFISKRKNITIISMAAGVSTNDLEDMSFNEAPIIRIMPNTPASVGEGMILYCCSDSVSNTTLNDFIDSFSLCGKLDQINENLIDAASAVSGCGPAFIFMFIQSLADAGVKCGLSREKALLYAEQTVLGSAKLALLSNEHPEKLKDNVCSPAGSTIAGVSSLENGSFRGLVENAVTASFNRTKELFTK